MSCAWFWACAIFPFFSCLSMLDSLPSTELTFGPPLPNTVAASELRLESVVHVPGVMARGSSPGRDRELSRGRVELSPQAATKSAMPTAATADRRRRTAVLRLQG